MKIKKIFASVAAVAAASALSVSVSAADWAKAGYADDNPATVNILSTDANGATFTATADGEAAKLRITLVDILENPEDVSKVKSGSWKVTYNGLSSLTGTDVGWLGGGCYCATGNSVGFALAPNDWAEDGTAIWEDSQVLEDSFKYLLPSSVPTDAESAEFVFMDWSSQNLVSNNITLTISDLKIFDADGNELPQKSYSGAGAAAPAADTAATTATATGNASAAAVAGIMAAAGAAALVSRKRK